MEILIILLIQVQTKEKAIKMKNNKLQKIINKIKETPLKGISFESLRTRSLCSIWIATHCYLKYSPYQNICQEVKIYTKKALVDPAGLAPATVGDDPTVLLHETTGPQSPEPKLLYHKIISKSKLKVPAAKKVPFAFKGKWHLCCAFISLFLYFFISLTPAKAANINFSLEAWIKPTTSIATKAILVKDTEMRLVTDASGYLNCQIHNGTAWQTAGSSSTTALELNKWQQVGCSYDGANIRVYINGALKGTQAMTADAQNTTNKFFAGYDAGGIYGRFSGKIDEIAIYNDVLSQQEFADHYSKGNLYKDENNNLKFEIGGLNLSADVSTWTANSWHMITAMWDPMGVNRVSGSTQVYGALYVDGASAGTSTTAFKNPSSAPTSFYFAQDSLKNHNWDGTIQGLTFDESLWNENEISSAYNSGSGGNSIASAKTNFMLSTASTTDVVSWSHSGNLAADGNMEDGDIAEWTGSASGYVSAESGSIRDEQDLAGGWNFEDDLTDATGNNTLTGTNIAAADYVEGKFGKAIDFDGSTEYLSQTSYYTQADDDGEASGVLTDGSATVIINDTSNLSTTYDASGGINNYMIVMTDSASQVAWGYLGTNSFSTPNNTYEIYSTRTGTTQNYAAKGTFSFSNTPITYQIRKTDFQITGALTVGAWIKLAASQSQKSIISKHSDSYGGYSFGIDDSQANKIKFHLNNYAAAHLTSTTSLNDGLWHFIACTYSNPNAAIYVDGVSNTSASNWSTVSNDTNVRLNIARWPGGETQYFNGLIDSPFVASRAYSADEIRKMYQQGWNDKFGAKIRLVTDDAASYLDESLTSGTDYLLSFDYRLGESNINPINFTAVGTLNYVPEVNVMGTSLTGLVGAWNFEEGTGSTVADLSGNGNTGTITNASWSTSGKFGKALSFDGDGDYVSIVHNSVLKPANQISIGAWVKPTNIHANWNYEIYRKEDGSDRHLLSFQEYGTILSFGINIGGSYAELDLPISYADYENVWSYIIAVYDGSYKRIYKNGVQIGSVVSSGAIGTTGSNIASIGDSSIGSESFSGIIDSVRIYNRALTADEVYQQYKEGLKYTYSTSFESDLTGANLFKFIQNGATSGDSIVYVDNVNLMANLVDKGGMEGTFTDGIPAGWSATTDAFEAGEGVEETTERHTGAKSFELVDADDGEGIKQTITVASGSWYTLEIWAKNNNQDVEAVITGGATDTIDLTTANNTWNRSYRTYKFNSTNITVQIQSGAADQDGFFDDVSLVVLGSSAATVASSNAAFTPNFGSQAGKVSGDYALNITKSDNLQFDEGALVAGVNYENFNPNQGAIKTWVKPYWDGTDAGEHVILENNNGTDYFKLYYSAGNLYYKSYVSSTSYTAYKSVADWTAGTWYHIAATWSKENYVNNGATEYILNLYVNGSDSGNTYSGVTAGTNYWVATAPSTLYIGQDSSAANQFNGLFSGLSVFNYPLSSGEISSDYNSGSGSSSSLSSNTIFYLPANSADADGAVRMHLKNYRQVTAGEYGLVAGYNFEDAATDVTGTYTGTWSGSAGYSTSGKYGSAADFDGSTDYIDLGDVGF